MKAHMHMPGWMHFHKPDWHVVGMRMDHLVHDPRFWAAVALAVLLGLMILTTILAEPGSGETSMPQTFPIYPYAP
ncbi:MAG: hypothetical protein ABFR90_07725 [Planctomycetota bacterium]